MWRGFAEDGVDFGGTADRPGGGGQGVGLRDMAAALGVDVAVIEVPSDVSLRRIEISAESSSYRPHGDPLPAGTVMECVSIWYEIEGEEVLVKTSRASVDRATDDQVRDVLSNRLMRPAPRSEDENADFVRERLLLARRASIRDIAPGPRLDGGWPDWRGARVGSTLAIAASDGGRIVAVAGPEWRVRSVSLTSVG